MATLHVRNMPDDLYARVQQLAISENRSISAQVVSLLEDALQTKAQQSETLNTKQILADIRRRHRVRPADFGLPDSTTTIREDRNR